MRSHQKYLLLVVGSGFVAWTGIFFSCGKKDSNSDSNSTAIFEDSDSLVVNIKTGELTGASATFPPNVFEDGTKVSLKSADVQPAEFAALGDLAAASPPMTVAATDGNGKAIITIEKAMTLVIPEVEPVEEGALVAVEKVTANLCVALTGLNGSSYVWRFEALTYDANTERVEILTKNFGDYQLLYCGQTLMPNFKEVDGDGEEK
jgi:hypothetical protein